MPKLTALMAIPGAGKSTRVQENTDQWSALICPDQYRQRLTGDASDQSRNDEVFQEAHEDCGDWLQDYNVIWDATNVTARARADILKTAKEAGATTKLVVLDVPLAVAKERNAQRERVVPEDVLDRMFGQFHDSLSQIGHEGWDEIEFVREA